MANGKERPVAYTSRSLSQAEQNYAQIEQEALAIVFAVRRFHQYLYRREFTLVTDHRPLCKIYTGGKRRHLTFSTSQDAEVSVVV